VSIRIARAADLVDLAGTNVGTADWIDVTQDRVDRFADATGDHQWIHTDPQRAATGPFGGRRPACIADAVVLYR
jgi:acyl dehydratase